jgi:hypothetical protein
MTLEFYEPTLQDLTPGSLFSYYSPCMKNSKKGQWEKHFFLLLKTSKNGKSHLLLPLTSSCPNSGLDKWSLNDDSSSLTLPSPYLYGMNGHKKPGPSYLSCNMLQWFTTEDMLTLGKTLHQGGEEYTMNYLGTLSEEFMSKLLDCLQTDLYENLPTEQKPLSLYQKMQKSYESETGTTYKWKGWPYPW